MVARTDWKLRASGWQRNIEGWKLTAVYTVGGSFYGSSVVHWSARYARDGEERHASGSAGTLHEAKRAAEYAAGLS